MIDQVTPAQWRDWMAQQASQGAALMLDVREDWELQTASVRADGFELRHIPMGQLVQRLSELDPERPIACLCHHGGRSMQVAAYLERNGFTSLYNLAGGMDAWANTVDPAMATY